MAMVSGVEQARDCYLRRAWREACDGFLAHERDLEPDDLERLAVSACLLGRIAESDDAWTRAHRIRLEQGDLVGTVRCAFWLCFRLVNAFDRPGANGWLARIERLVVETSQDSLERARLAYLTGLRAAFDGDLSTSESDLGASADLAFRCGDDELAALARLSLGRVLIFRGEIAGGVRLLDEAMLVMWSEPFSPIAVGTATAPRSTPATTSSTCTGGRRGPKG